VRHVGDVDPEGDRAVAVALEADRVVVVPGRVGVDGDHGQAGQVLSVRILGGVEGAGRATGRVEHFVREMLGQAVGTHHGAELDLRNSREPERLQDHPRRQVAPVAVLHDLHDHLEAGGALGLGNVAHDDRGAGAFAVGDHEPGAVRTLEGPHAASQAALADLDHLAAERSPLAAPTTAQDAGDDEVTGHRAAGLVRRNEQVTASVGLLGDDEAEAARVSLEAADHGRGR